MAQLSVQQVSIDDVSPHPRNVRQGDVGAIMESLSAHGQYRPIVVQKSTGSILAGNHTWKAAKTLGWKEIAVTYVDVDDEKALRILLIDNRANDLATYDDSQLADLLQMLASTEIGFDGTGFDGDDLDDLLFKLNGSLGSMTEGMSNSERREEYEARGVRSFVFPYPEHQYEDMVGMLKKMRDYYGADNNADALFAMLKAMD